MAAQWEEAAKTGGDRGTKRMEGSPVQLEVMQHVPELVVHERMSQGIGVKGIKEKKKVSGWSIEKMKEQLSIAVKENTEEVKKWRGLSQSEIRPKLEKFGGKNERGSPGHV